MPPYSEPPGTFPHIQNLSLYCPEPSLERGELLSKPSTLSSMWTLSGAWTGTCLEVLINSPEIHFFCRKYSVYISQHYILLYTIIPQQQTARLGLSQFVGFRAPFWFVYAIFQWPNFHSHSMTGNFQCFPKRPCVAQVNVSWPDWEGHLRLPIGNLC